MMHTMVTFTLHRKGVILVALGGVLVAVLLFAAGYLTGLGHRPVPAGAAKPLPAPKPGGVSPPHGSGAAAGKPVPGAPSGAVSAPPPAGEGKSPPEVLTLQVGVFDTEEEAQELAARLAEQRYTAGVAASTTDDSETRYVVRLGQFATRGEAAATAATLRRNEGLAASVVMAPPAAPAAAPPAEAKPGEAASGPPPEA